MPRTPDDILTSLDAIADGYADRDEARKVLWEVLEDMLDSLGRYATWEFESSAPADVVRECKGMLTDYLVNNYGDD